MSVPASRRSEIAALYPQVAPQLRRVLTSHLQAPAWVLEDACQIAWEALLGQAEPVDQRRVLSWLATTARREALAILRRTASEMCVTDSTAEALLAPAPGPEQAVEFWERMGQIRRLSRRQQRIVWMQGLGFQYSEIADEVGDSLRTVERQLAGARRKLRAA
ncbi:MAG TPA: sigma-70 family RNA polymerase sigma factor [Solirubrobacteraceae bacterium]|nr:sigma-70 family RNA polymerase sigma factor [Solirubrobacteraceae bacterium]